LKKILLILILLSAGNFFAQPKFTELSGKAGAFSRLGFGARGIGIANAMSAVTEGNLAAYYNPAVSVFQENNSFQTGYSFLSLDRSLNFLNFTRRFDFYSAADSTNINRKPRSTAGLSIGIINSGVGKIDERDNQGIKRGDIATSENMAFLGLANRFSEKLSLGIGIKFYYYKLYEEISSTGVGLDVGALYKVNDQWNIALMISDINSKYKWDSSPIYEQAGTNTEDKIPVLKKLGVSYKNSEAGILASMEIENSNAGSNFLRFGIEFNLYENFYLRGGIDQLNLSNSDHPLKPAAGFSYAKYFGTVKIGIDYAFMMEQYSPADRHIVGVNFQF